ncbi:MAG: CvpA family protein [Pseudomonadota bacterium]
MNGLDLTLAIVLLFFFLRGIFRGFVKEIAGIVGLILGFMVANASFQAAADLLKPYLQNPSYRQAAGFTAVFIVVFVLVGVAGVIFDKIVKIAVSRVANGLWGAGIGLLKGLVLSAVLLMIATGFIKPENNFFKNSVSWPYLKYVSNGLKTMVPQDLRESLEKKAEMLPDKLKPMVPDLKPDPNIKPPDLNNILPKNIEPPKPAWPKSTD